MSLTVKIPDEVETQVRQRAANCGIDPQGLVVDVLRRQFSRCQASPNHGVKSNVLDTVETRLYTAINKALPIKTRQRYDELVKKRRRNRISRVEYDELLRLTNVVEKAHARRLKAAAELAEYQGVDFDALLDQLGFTSQHDE